MSSFGIGLILMSLISGDALIISGGNLAHIDSETGTVTPSVGVLHTYPNDVIIHEGFAFVVNSGVDTGTLQRFEMDTWALTELGLGTGWNCWASIPLADGKLAVSATLNNSVCMVDPGTMQIASSINGIGPNPEWMAAENNLLYTACGGWGAGESVVVANITTGSVLDTLTAGTNCQSVVLEGGLLFATCSGAYGSDEGSVVVIDLSTGGTTAELAVGGFPAFSTAANGILYVSDPWGAGVYSVDMATLDVLHDSSDPFCSGGNGMAVDDSGYLWISDGMNGEIRVYDTAENLVQTYEVTSPAAIAVSGTWLGINGGGVETGVSISVFPNPAVNLITVTGASPGERIRIFDITGRIAGESVTGGNGLNTVDITNLKAGVYTVINGTSSARFAVTAR
ncbi:MAG: T9SS type A sorting domain-containing protein [Candidatus Sabulitectum sp.]|nr:T9SS type A sorting domain-containing protein [Candidatus Sabulitectum sp.]